MQGGPHRAWTLTGLRPQGYTLDNGGPLTGNVTITKFVHCGVGENLDPLFNAGISRPGNFQLLTQGILVYSGAGSPTGLPPQGSEAAAPR